MESIVIELGKKKGTKNENHFIIKMNSSIKNFQVISYEFDVYAETPEEAFELIKQFFKSRFSSYGFKVETDNPQKPHCAQACSNCNLSLDECRQIGGIR